MIKRLFGTRLFGTVVGVVALTAAGESMDKFLIEDASCGAGDSSLSLCRGTELDAALPPNVHTPHSDYELQQVSLPGFLPSGASTSSISANPVFRMTRAGEDVA